MGGDLDVHRVAQPLELEGAALERLTVTEERGFRGVEENREAPGGEVVGREPAPAELDGTLHRVHHAEAEGMAALEFPHGKIQGYGEAVLGGSADARVREEDHVLGLKLNHDFSLHGALVRAPDFFHLGRVGHGLGLAVHDPGRIGPVSAKLQAGAVVTVEPGLYYPG
ncbi:MAG: M24 family metallopeptidase, partial [Bdellovibrionales bacterium]|nr:M24 family metallopeptidase [Bdellovibrionales bacterium]